MKKLLLILLCVTFVGCATIPPNSYQQTPYGFTYNNYEIEIISEPSGAKIEWNNDYIGTTPLKRILNGDNSTLSSVEIIAHPVYEGQRAQTKKISGWNPFPKTIYFDMNLR